jgi:tetratricopeptide (TPR) repeat protein
MADASRHGPRPNAGLALALLVAWPCPLAAKAPPREPGPPLAWLDLVARYAAGDRDGAVAGFSSWTSRDLDDLRSGFDQWRRAVRSCSAETTERQQRRDDCRLAERYRAVPFRRAILLHTERAWFEQRRLPPDDESPHAVFARSLVEKDLLPGTGEAAAFARGWYLYMALRAHEEMLLYSAAAWARAGLARLPGDAVLALALATAEESIGSVGQPPPRTLPANQPAQDTRALQVWRARLGAHRERLHAAAQALEVALRLDPGLDEAAVRLGRVRWRLGEPEAARQALEQVLRRSHDDHQRYLAWLFLGRVHEDAGRTAEAEAAYRAAAALDPRSQAARIALSHLLLGRGDEAASRAALDDGLRSAGLRERPDAFWEYPWGHSSEAAARLRDLRAAAGP